MVEIQDDEETEMQNLICKITDFGFATMIESRKKTLSVGSPIYMAPEVLNRMYDSKADVWSLGVIAYILVTSKQPFEGEDDAQLFSNIRYFAPDYSGLRHYLKEGKYVTDFLQKCLNKNQNSRANANDLLHHKWF